MTLRVKVMPGDGTGCGFYRCLEPVRVISESTTDVDFQVVMADEDDGALEVDLHGKLNEVHVVGVKDPECDILVLQRPATRLLAEAIPYVQRYGTTVVCEYDDDFDTVHPRNPAWRAYEPQFSPDSNKVWAKLCSELADFVTVSTPRLAKRYGSHGLVAVLPNYVPAWYLDVTGPRASRITIGWGGFSKTHHGDLQIVGQSVQKLCDSERANFKGIGDEGMLKPLGLKKSLHTEVTPWADLDDYPALVRASIGLGIVPLADSTFNRSKSWIKGLEYAALGIPFVASPLPEYVKLNQLGIGDLVPTTTANTSVWQRALLRYLEDEEYTRLRAEEGRIQAAGMTYEKHAEEWLIAWMNARVLATASGT